MASTRTISLQSWWRASSCQSLFYIKFVWICSSTAAYLKDSLAVGTTSSVSFLGASLRLYRWHLFNSCFLFFFCSFRFRTHNTPITLSYAFTHSIPLSESWKRMENPHFSYVFFNINNFLLNRKPKSQAVWLNYDLASVFCWTLLVKWTRQLWSKQSKSDGRSSWRSLGGKVLLSTISWSSDQPPPSPSSCRPITVHQIILLFESEIQFKFWRFTSVSVFFWYFVERDTIFSFQ